MMKKFINPIILTLSIALVLSACTKEKVDTAQYSDTEVTLVSFGPNPVMRGATLCFYGSNLDQVTAVNVPGVEPITSIEVVTEGKISEIRVQLPSENEEPGAVTLTTAKGKILTTQAELTYTEPIVFDSFSVEKKGDTAMPGDKITFKGDYMNLVMWVTFTGGEKVAVEKIDRHSSYAVIPATALTGKVILSDGGTIENLLYSAEDLVMGEPAVTSLSCSTCRPDSLLSITGEYLNMIQYISFAGGTVLDNTSFKVSEDHKGITLNLPGTAGSGTVTAISYSGTEYDAGEISMVIPSELTVSPQPVKAGNTLKIKGKDLDLVKTLDFPNSAGAEFMYSFSDSTITVTVPSAAQEGDLTLSMANSDQVTAAYTLIHPAVTKITPVELYAGDDITVTGTDLDLVTGATLAGKEVEFKADSETRLTVTTAKNSVSGKLVFTLANGETVEPETEIAISYHSVVIVNEMPSAEHIGGIVTLKGENFMKVENISIGEAKVTDYTFRSDTLVSFVMPYNKIGTYNIYFDLFSGDRETCPQTMEVLLELTYTTIWEGSWTCAGWDGNQELAWGGFDWSTISASDMVRFYLTPTVAEGDWWCISLRHGDSWGALPNPPIPGQYDTPGTILAVEFTRTVLDDLIANNGLVITGTGYTLTKIEVTHEIPQERTLWSGTADLGAWSVNWQVGDGTFGADNPNMFADAGLKAGDEIRLYCTAQDWWQIQFFNGHWEGQTEIGVATGLNNGNNINAGIYTIQNGYIAIPVTETLKTQLTTLNDWGYCWIIQGENLVITKIAVF